MRTLDSGIGTFPLPDSVSRASGRHIPKSESSPDGVTAGSAELQPPSCPTDPSQPSVKVIPPPKSRLHAPTGLGHSLSDPSVTCSGGSSSSGGGDATSRLPKPAGKSLYSLTVDVFAGTSKCENVIHGFQD